MNLFRAGASYFRGKYIWNQIKVILNELFVDIDRRDVKLRGELLEGASFTLLNLVFRTELLAALRLPLELKSGTIGKVNISGLDCLASRKGKLTVSIFDVTFVLATPGDEDRLGPEHLAASRRTLLQVLTHALLGMEPGERTLQGFLLHVLGSPDWAPIDSGQGSGKSGKSKDAKRPANPKADAKAEAKVAAEAKAAAAKAAEDAADRVRWVDYAFKNVELVITNVHVRVETANDDAQGAAQSCSMVSALGLTLPTVRLRSTDKPQLSVLTHPSAGGGGGGSVFPVLLTLSNVAVYCDPSVPSYLPSLLWQRPKAGKDQHSRSTSRSGTPPRAGSVDPGPEGANPKRWGSRGGDAPAPAQNAPSASGDFGGAGSGEGLRRVTWLRQRWTDQHEGLVFPASVNAVVSMILADGAFMAPPPRDETTTSAELPWLRCDSVDVRLGSVRVCTDARQVESLALATTRLYRAMRRDHCLGLVLDVPGLDCWPFTVTCGSTVGPLPMVLPPVAVAMPPGSYVPLPTTVLSSPTMVDDSDGVVMVGMRKDDATEDLLGFGGSSGFTGAAGSPGVAWLKRTLGPGQWARKAWRWAVKCVVLDLRPWHKGCTWPGTLRLLRSQQRLVALYKQRHLQARKARAAAAVASSRRPPRPPVADAAAAAEFAPSTAELSVPSAKGIISPPSELPALFLFDGPLTSASSEWELACLELRLPAKGVLLAQALARIELVLESQRASVMRHVQRQRVLEREERSTAWGFAQDELERLNQMDKQGPGGASALDFALDLPPLVLPETEVLSSEEKSMVLCDLLRMASLESRAPTDTTSTGADGPLRSAFFSAEGPWQ